jgi:hypothetical protein
MTSKMIMAAVEMNTDMNDGDSKLLLRVKGTCHSDIEDKEIGDRSTIQKNPLTSNAKEVR